MSTQPEFDNEELYSWIVRQSEMGPRRPGSPADHENEDFLLSKLEDFGLESVRKEPIPITYWNAEEYQLEVGVRDDLKPMECFPIPYTRFTPESGIEALTVYADPRKLLHRDDWSGKIVVTQIGFPDLDATLLQRLGLGVYDPDDTIKSFDHPATWVRLGWHLYRKAVRRGAVGFIGVIKDQPGGGCRMYAPYGFREKDIMDKPIPGLWVGREEGRRLATMVRSGDVYARIKSLGIEEPGVMHNVLGDILGRSDDESMFLSCHHDSPFVSPVEDGSGVAVVLAIARHFAQAKSLERRLVVGFTGGHFYGSLGTRNFIEKHRHDIVARTAVALCIEHIALEAVEDAKGTLGPSGLPEAAGIFVPLNRLVADAVLESVTSHDLGRSILLPAEGPLGDYPPTDGGDWYEAGIPVVNYICNPVYLLTDDDALDWVDKNRLAVAAGTFVDIIEKLDAMPRHAIGEVDSKLYLLKMKMVKHIARNKTTLFGLKPVY